MKPPPQSCKTCRWAKWNYTATGRINKYAGRCLYVVTLPALPYSVTAHHSFFKDQMAACRSAIRPDCGATCPTRAAKEKEGGK